MTTEAAIKRASRQAQRAMRELDAESLDELIQFYEQAADQVRAAIRARADASDLIGQQQYRGLMLQIDDILTRLGQDRDALIRRQIDAAATLGVQPYTAQGMGAVGGTEAVLESAAAMLVAQQAVRFTLEFTAADGLQLSDRVWRLDQGAREVFQRAIGQAVVQGWNASKATADLIYRGQAVPPEVTARVRAAKVDQLVNVADLLTGEGGEIWKAQRVLRTEINRAHGEAFMSAGERTPGFAGWRFLLSPQHPRPDICDLLAAQNLHGLGPGVYPDRESCPWPAHPNTLSFVEIVFKDEITEADRKGKETELEALQRLAPEIRAGVLGVTKAEYFDKGLLTRGMIGGSVASAKNRIDQNLPGDFVSRSLENPRQRQAAHVLGPISEAALKRASALGLNLAGKSLALDHDGVIHTFKEHGGESEKTRGQRPITTDDFSNFANLFNSAQLRPGDPAKASDGTFRIDGVVTADGYRYNLVASVRRKFVVLHSMWKRPQK